MKVNKSKSPFAGESVNAPDEKDIAKAVKGEKFAETLSALESEPAADGAPNATRAALSTIVAQYDLSDEENRQSALQESAEFLIKSRLNEEYQKSEKIVQELGKYVTEDPFLKTKLLSVLQKLSDSRPQ